MTYEKMGQDIEDLSLTHAARQGAHNAVSDMVKYTTLAVVGGVVAALVFNVSPRDMGRRLRKVVQS